MCFLNLQHFLGAASSAKSAFACPDASTVFAIEHLNATAMSAGMECCATNVRIYNTDKALD
jgi:hypothetical protein